jgi:DNA-binding transcriptional LysR family regulator
MSGLKYPLESVILRALLRMNSIPRSNLEHWAVLRAVVEYGGFAQAAARLHRSQSAVSYAVARLQEAIGTALLEVQGRRAVLTHHGRKFLDEAIPLIDDLVRLEERARLHATGGVTNLNLAVDSLFPRERLFDALTQFANQFPNVKVSLRETVRQAIDSRESFDLAVVVEEPSTAFLESVGQVQLHAVARADHPLFKIGETISAATLARFNRAEIRSHEWQPKSEHQKSDTRIWRINTIESAVEAVKHGLCFAWLPEHLISADLESGEIRRLALEAGSIRVIRLVLCRGQHSVGGDDPAICAMAGLLGSEQVLSR